MRGLVLLLLVSSAAHGAAKKFDWPTAFTAALPVAYGQLVLHEASHGLFAQEALHVPVEYHLYPGFDWSGTLRVAFVQFPPTDYRADLLVSATAEIFDAVVVLGVFAVDHLFDLPIWLRTILKVWQAACVVDFAFNMLGLWRPGTGLSPQNDFRDVWYGYLGASPALARSITGAAALGMGALTVGL